LQGDGYAALQGTVFACLGFMRPAGPTWGMGDFLTIVVHCHEKN
jgi:hypothetical protein